MTSRRRSGIILGYANIVVKNVVNLLYTPMLLAFVGKGDYGVFQTAHSFVFSLSLLAFGFSGAYVRFYSQRKAACDENSIRVLNGMYLLIYLIICAIVIAVGLVLSANVDSFFSDSFTPSEVGLAGSLMAIMTFTVAATLFSTVFDASIIVHEEFVFQQTRQMFTVLATPGLALILLNLGFETVGVAVAQLAVTLLLLALNARFAVRRLHMEFDFKDFDLTLLKSLAAFSGWIFVNQVCDTVNQNVPNVILGAQCGSMVVAVLAVSIQIRNVFISLSTTMSNVFVPKVNRVVASSGDNAELTAIMTMVGRYQMIILGWVYGGFAIVGRFFIEKWAGASFADAYWLLLAMVLPLLVPLSQNVGIEIQKAKNMHKARSIVYFVMAALSVVFTAMFSPTLGYWAPAIAYIMSITFGNCVFMNWYYHSKVGLDMIQFWGSMLPVIVCVAGSMAVCLLGTKLFPVQGWSSFLCWGAVYTAVLCLLVWLFVLTSNERSDVHGKISMILSGGSND